jgi:hypothetical protein
MYVSSSPLPLVCVVSSRGNSIVHRSSVFKFCYIAQHFVSLLMLPRSEQLRISFREAVGTFIYSELVCSLWSALSLRKSFLGEFFLSLSHTQMHTDLFLCQTEALVCDCLSADACTHWLCTEKPSGRPKPTHQLKFRCTSGWPQKQTFPRTWHSFMKFTKPIKTKSTVLNN